MTQLPRAQLVVLTTLVFQPRLMLVVRRKVNLPATCHLRILLLLHHPKAAAFLFRATVVMPRRPVQVVLLKAILPAYLRVPLMVHPKATTALFRVMVVVCSKTTAALRVMVVVRPKTTRALLRVPLMVHPKATAALLRVMVVMHHRAAMALFRVMVVVHLKTTVAFLRVKVAVHPRLMWAMPPILPILAIH